MTAEKARQLTDEAINSVVEMDSIYSFIDYNIEEEATKGNSSYYATVDGCDESWDVVLKKREKIIEHYTELGFTIEPNGYDRCITSDTFTISW